MPNIFGFVRIFICLNGQKFDNQRLLNSLLFTISILPNLDLFQVLQQILSCEGEDRGWKDYSQEVQMGWKYYDISNILML